jgi:hypothetical protein
MASETIERVLGKYDSHVKLLSTVAIVIGAVITIAGGYNWYRSNLWKPSVTITDVDFTNGVAHIIINGVQKTLYGNSVLAAGGLWGVQFGTTGLGSGQYDTVELTKNSMVYDILKTK